MPENIAAQISPGYDQELRSQLLETLGEITAWDQLEQEHLTAAKAWILSGAPLWRVQKPDIPPMHLVSYFVVFDEVHEKILLVAHRNAGLWLPTGGHVEPGEHPWQTVLRECQEELSATAVPAAATGETPLFLTINQTQGQGQHLDVSLWYLLTLDMQQVSRFDQGEFKEIAWFSLDEVLDQPLETLDRHLHRFIHKLRMALSVEHSRW